MLGMQPGDVAVSPHGSLAYVTHSWNNSVSVIDTNNNTVLTTIGVGSNPNGVAVSPNGTLAYVANADSNTVSVIDTATHTVIDTNPSNPGIDSIVVGLNPGGVAVSPNGSVYVSNWTSNTVSVISLVPMTTLSP